MVIGSSFVKSFILNHQYVITHTIRTGASRLDYFSAVFVPKYCCCIAQLTMTFLTALRECCYVVFREVIHETHLYHSNFRSWNEPFYKQHHDHLT